MTTAEIEYNRITFSLSSSLKKSSSVDLFQVRSLSQKRLALKIGKVDEDIIVACKKTLSMVSK